MKLICMDAYTQLNKGLPYFWSVNLIPAKQYHRLVSYMEDLTELFMFWFLLRSDTFSNSGNMILIMVLWKIPDQPVMPFSPNFMTNLLSAAINLKFIIILYITWAR